MTIANDSSSYSTAVREILHWNHSNYQSIIDLKSSFRDHYVYFAIIPIHTQLGVNIVSIAVLPTLPELPEPPWDSLCIVPFPVPCPSVWEQKGKVSFYYLQSHPLWCAVREKHGGSSWERMRRGLELFLLWYKEKTSLKFKYHFVMQTRICFYFFIYTYRIKFGLWLSIRDLKHVSRKYQNVLG